MLLLATSSNVRLHGWADRPHPDGSPDQRDCAIRASVVPSPGLSLVPGARNPRRLSTSAFNCCCGIRSSPFDTNRGAPRCHRLRRNVVTQTDLRRAHASAPNAHSEPASPSPVQATDAANGAPGTTRTCDLGIRRPLLYPPELRRQCAGQSIQHRLLGRRRRHNAPEKCLRTRKIGYRVGLDTRTTPAGHRSLTATMRVPDVEGCT